MAKEEKITVGKAKSRIDYKWIVLSVTTVGALMASIDSTIVIIGLPSMMAALHSDLVSMIWVIMAYILVSTVDVVELVKRSHGG